MPRVYKTIFFNCHPKQKLYCVSPGNKLSLFPISYSVCQEPGVWQACLVVEKIKRGAEQVALVKRLCYTRNKIMAAEPVQGLRDIMCI